MINILLQKEPNTVHSTATEAGVSKGISKAALEEKEV